MPATIDDPAILAEIEGALAGVGYARTCRVRLQPDPAVDTLSSQTCHTARRTVLSDYEFAIAKQKLLEERWTS